MQQKYGEPPIVITFNYGDGGTVLHMTSHYYLQRAELRTKRHKMSAKEYAMKEVGLSASEADMEEQERLSLGEAESAYSTTQFISNVIVEQQKNIKKRKKQKKEEKK